MVDPGEILITIINNFAKIIPRRTIYEYEKGLKWRRGKILKEINGGHVSWFIPLLESIDTEAVKDRVVDTSRQDVITKDKKPITVSASLTYEIKDLVAYYTKLYEHGASIINLAELAIFGEITRLELNELYDSSFRQKGQQRSDLEKSLLDNIKKSSSAYGIDVKSFGLVNLTSARTYRIIGNTNGGISEET